MIYILDDIESKISIEKLKSSKMEIKNNRAEHLAFLNINGEFLPQSASLYIIRVKWMQAEKISYLPYIDHQSFHSSSSMSLAVFGLPCQRLLHRGCYVQCSSLVFYPIVFS